MNPDSLPYDENDSEVKRVGEDDSHKEDYVAETGNSDVTSFQSQPNEMDVYQDDSENNEDPEYDWELAEAKEQWDKSGKDIIFGLLWAVGGTVVTAVSYNSAASSPTGGRYIIAWGAIVFGAIQFFNGLIHRISNSKPAEDNYNQIDKPPKKFGMRWIIAFVVVVVIAALIISNINTSSHNDTPESDIESREIEALADYNKPQLVIDESLLEDDEITDGKVIFKRPEKSYMEKRPLDPDLPNGDYAYYFANNRQADGYELYVVSDIVDNMPTEAEFDEVFDNWKPDWAKDWKQSTIKNDVTDTDDGRAFERVCKYSQSGLSTIKSRFILVYNEKISKACIIVAYEAAGHTAPVESVKNSIKFYNNIN